MSPPPTGQPEPHLENMCYARLDIDSIGAQSLKALKQESAIVWWVELNDQLLVLTHKDRVPELATKRPLTVLDIPVDEIPIYFVSRSADFNVDVIVLAEGSRSAVIKTTAGSEPIHRDGELCRHGTPQKLTFTPNTVLERQHRNHEMPLIRSKTNNIAQIVDRVDGDRWFANVQMLASFNRYTRGDEIHAARDWLIEQFEAIPNLQVSTQSFSVGSTPAHNVIAVLPGKGTSDDFYIVGAHYDAISEISVTTAPGAEDNASGTAAVLEIARALAPEPVEHTIVFMCYSGEEQGLRGSAAHASGLVSAGQASNMKTALIMDMIGYAVNPNDLTVLLETNSMGSFLFSTMMAAAQNHTDINTVTTLFPFGSDHMSYLNRNMPAILTIDDDWDAYPSYHRSHDLPGNLVQAMGEGIVRMNVATMAELAGAVPQEGLPGDYYEAWQQAPNPPFLRDINQNFFIDVADIIARLQR